MDGFKVGDRCVPLPNGTRYAPKEWKLSVDVGGKRTWTEIELTSEAQDYCSLESTIWWANHPTWERTPPVSQADIDKYNLPQEYLDGFAVFSQPMYYPKGKSPEAKAARLETEKIWESHYREMEAKQTIIRPPDKPEDASGTGNYFSELRRGD